MKFVRPYNTFVFLFFSNYDVKYVSYSVREYPHNNSHTCLYFSVQVMNEILFGIRVIKFYAWEEHFAEKIKALRGGELASLRGRKYLDAWCVYFWATTPVLISILSFSTYALLGHQLTAAKVSYTLGISIANFINYPAHIIMIVTIDCDFSIARNYVFLIRTIILAMQPYSYQKPWKRRFTKFRVHIIIAVIYP